MHPLKNYTVNELEEIIKTGIYKIENKLNNKFYIGSAAQTKKENPSERGFYVRWRKHICELNTQKHDNSYLQRAWNKYGPENFEFSIIHFCPAEECIEFEDIFLALLSPHYNLCKRASSVYGRKCSEETKQKIREAQLGQKRPHVSAKKAKPFYLVSPEGKEITGKNLVEFCKANDLSRAHIHGVTKGKVFHSKGWTASLTAHKLYLDYYENRGIGKSKDGWSVYLGQGQYRYFSVKEKAIELRNRLVEEGKDFLILSRNWRDKLKELEGK